VSRIQSSSIILNVRQVDAHIRHGPGLQSTTASLFTFVSRLQTAFPTHSHNPRRFMPWFGHHPLALSKLHPPVIAIFYHLTSPITSTVIQCKVFGPRTQRAGKRWMGDGEGREKGPLNLCEFRRIAVRDANVFHPHIRRCHTSGPGLPIRNDGELRSSARSTPSPALTYDPPTIASSTPHVAAIAN
jgi:hypothetical protein